MSSVVALLYTTIGGVLGAGLNQYVTHIKDRRTARASVIGCLQAAQDAQGQAVDRRRGPPVPRIGARRRRHAVCGIRANPRARLA
jgi:hypothetical protein